MQNVTQTSSDDSGRAKPKQSEKPWPWLLKEFSKIGSELTGVPPTFLNAMEAIEKIAQKCPFAMEVSDWKGGIKLQADFLDTFFQYVDAGKGVLTLPTEGLDAIDLHRTHMDEYLSRLVQYCSLITDWSIWYQPTDEHCFGREWLLFMQIPQLNRLEVNAKSFDLKMIKAMASCSSLVYLDINGCGDSIVEGGYSNVEVVKLLAESKSITQLGLPSSVLNSQNRKEAEILARNPKLKKLKFNGWLAWSLETPLSAVSMLGFLANSKSLTELEMNEYKLEEPVAEALAAMPNLFRLQLGDSCLLSGKATEKLAKSECIKELKVQKLNVCNEENLPDEWLCLHRMLMRNMMPLREAVGYIAFYRANRTNPLRNSGIPLFRSHVSPFCCFLFGDHKVESEDTSVDHQVQVIKP